MTLGEYLKRFGDNTNFMDSDLAVTLEDKNGKLIPIDNEKVYKHLYDNYSLEHINFNNLVHRRELRIKEKVK